MNPMRPRTVPPWNLLTVLRALKGPPLEPLQSTSHRVHICKVLQPVCPCQSPFCLNKLSYRSLDQHYSSPHSLGLSILYGLQVSTLHLHLCIQQTRLSKATYSAFRLYIFCQYACSLGIEPTTICAANAMLSHWATGTQKRTGGHPGHSWPYGSACVWCIHLTPLGLTPTWNLQCWVVPRHSIAWLFLFPYKHLRRSTSEISKGNVLSYYRNLGSLEHETSTAFPAVLWAALLSRFFQRNLRCGGEAAVYIARCPSHFMAMSGCIAIGSCTAAKPLVHLLVLCEPMDLQFYCVIINGFSWRVKNSFNSTQFEVNHNSD